ARDALEAEVAARTSALKATQDELVHAAKMAALGQMSAAIAHEVNQPLAAIRTYIASARLLIERGAMVEATANLGQIDDLVGRMAALTGELKVF
ncbi:histidine kinase dimerization/phospho-acceptor domain-containing protein, partial [Klebsiella pneumoniae]